MIDQAELKDFLDWSNEHLSKKPEPFRHRFAPASDGLVAVAQGGSFSDGTHHSGGRRFLGWTTGKHWVLE